eukprot:scaffold104763_cov23-Cyclotella_meneghiniana.AAC.2
MKEHEIMQFFSASKPGRNDPGRSANNNDRHKSPGRGRGAGGVKENPYKPGPGKTKKAQLKGGVKDPWFGVDFIRPEFSKEGKLVFDEVMNKIGQTCRIDKRRRIDKET